MIRSLITTALGIADVTLEVVCVLRVYQPPNMLPPVMVNGTWQAPDAHQAALAAIDNGLALADAIRGLIGGGR